MATIRLRRGDLHLNAGRFAEAGEEYARALADWERIVAVNRSHYSRSMASVLGRMGKAHLLQGKAALAQRDCTRSLQLLAAYPPSNVYTPHYIQMVVDGYSDLGLACERLHRHAEARKAEREAVRLAAGLAGVDPGSMKARRMEALARGQLAQHYFESGDPDDALAEARKAILLADKLPRGQVLSGAAGVCVAVLYERIGRMFLLADAPDAGSVLAAAHSLCKDVRARQPSNEMFVRKRLDVCASIGQHHGQRDYRRRPKWHRTAGNRPRDAGQDDGRKRRRTASGAGVRVPPICAGGAKAVADIDVGWQTRRQGHILVGARITRWRSAAAFRGGCQRCRLEPHSDSAMVIPRRPCVRTVRSPTRTRERQKYQDRRQLRYESGRSRLQERSALAADPGWQAFASCPISGNVKPLKPTFNDVFLSPFRLVEKSFLVSPFVADLNT